MIIRITEVEAIEALSAAQQPNIYAEIDGEFRRVPAELLKNAIGMVFNGGYQDEAGYVHLTKDGEDIDGFEPFKTGTGSGGGGGDMTNATISVQNTTGWLAKTISTGADCEVSFLWSSIEDDMPTGNGTMRISVNGVVRATINIAQGNVTQNVGEYLGKGANIVRIQILDVYGQSRSINFTITVMALSISSSFDNTSPFTGQISFPYTPVGAVAKTVHFILDGTEIGTQLTSVSDRQMSYVIPAQSHGGHSLRVYLEAEINGETVRSNEMYFEFISVVALNEDTIIISPYNTPTQKQYSSVVIPYRVYDPYSDTAEVSLYVNNTLVSTQTVDRTEQTYTYRANTAGNISFKIASGGAEKVLTFTVQQSDIQVEAETEDLALYLTAQGRSNGEETRNIWAYNDIASVFTGFGWRLDGWQKDNDGIDVLRLVGDARLTIPYQIFGTDFKGTGKTIEIEFSTHSVANYNSVILSCFADNIGLQITPQNMMFRGAQNELSVLYKDNEHIRLSIVVEKQNDNRLILIYINGIMSRAIQYASGEMFRQLNPVGISIGSGDCGIDIYCIRVYDNNLNRKQVLDNWIADTQIGSVLNERYARNDVYDDYGLITTATLPNNLPYFVLEAPILPQYKGHKLTISGSYTDPVNHAKSFTFTGCLINVQGTSSAPYYRKNYDMQFKEGFMLESGPAENYALRTNSIPFNRFVLKADVASSESTNNTGLTMFYNDTCPYKKPEQVDDARVRWGIEGIPIAVFWYNTDDQTTQFMGKYNFNLPKRAPEPYGYSFNETDQSWEWERNNSANVKFQDNNFTDRTWDELNQKYYPTWYDDFEARFPSDEFRDYTVLNEFISWVKSTWRDQCTNENLPSPVTFRLSSDATVTPYPNDNSYTVVDEQEGGLNTGIKFITFTKDTPAYRLSKFRAELSDYVEIDSAVFYYLFTELFLMIDSRAKNMFVGFKGGAINDPNRAMKRKAVFEPYDMDTAVGTNNSGVLMFGYYLEDTDTVSSIISGGEGGSDANVFNAQDSVFWMNLRDSCRSEITTMYRNLRNSAWSYRIVENMYENHQSKWPEAIFNEDAYTKYLVPLIEAVTEDDTTGQKITTDRYLTMLQGSKTEQRKWWLYNRFRYMDSKFATGDASANRITMRLFNSGTLTVTPAIDLYVAVYFGGGTTAAIKRTNANVPVNFVYSEAAQEMETWIDSADMIADVGDLSVFYPNELDFSKATKLKRLKIGSEAEGYSNTNLRTVDVRNSSLLEHLDLRNCPNLGITVNLEGSPRIKEVYCDNTAVTGVDLVDGCAIEVLHLPETITTLTLMNLNNLEELEVESFENVTRLMIANIDQEIINPLEVLAQMPANSQVYIQGLDLEVESVNDIRDLFDFLDTMSGVTREKNANGEWVYHTYETAQVAGQVHVPNITGDEFEELRNRYPYIRVTYDSITTKLKYYTWDGGTLLHTETITDGGNGGSYSGQPARTATTDASYTFVGWSSTKNATVHDPNCLKAVTRNRNVYAAYSVTPIYHLYYYNYNGSELLYTENFVGGNGTGSYDGEPARTATVQETYTFIGWSTTQNSNTADVNALVVGTANKSVYAAYSVIRNVVISYYNWDGSELLHEEGVVSGGNGTWNGTPTRTATERILYNFAGWSSTTNASANESGVRSNITQNTTVYAAYTETAITYLKYYSYDGSELLHTDTIYNGANGTWNGVGPERTSTAQYSYSFVGWSTSPEQTAATSGATTSVSADRNVYAAYSQAIRSYTVYFYNGSTLAQTKQNINYGSSASWSGADPVYSGSDPGEWTFTGWSPEPTNITGDTSCYAQYRDTSSLTGKYLSGTLTSYSSNTNTVIGDYAFYGMNTLTTVSAPATTVGYRAFRDCQNLTNVTLSGDNCSIGDEAFTNCSKLETVTLNGFGTHIINAAAFSNCTKMNALIIRANNMATLNNANAFNSTQIGSDNGAIYVQSSLVPLYKADANWKNFFIKSIEEYPVTDFSTISDSWSEIFASEDNGTYSSKYAIGDTKKLNVNGNDVYMQIVAFDTDELASGSGNAKITWIAKDIRLNHRMNASNNTTNGWAATEMRTWLRNTILPTIDSTVRSNIKEVTKTYKDVTTSSTLSISDTIWIPSYREVYGDTSYEDSGCVYSGFFNNSSAMIKKNSQVTSATWWLRSARSESYFGCVNSGGSASGSYASNVNWVAIGFCT